MKIAVILNTEPLEISCDVDEHGYVRKQKLVNVLGDNDINAILTALTLGGEVDVFTVGKSINDVYLRAALAYGASNGYHIGDNDWPDNPRIDLYAQGVVQALDQEYSLILLSDTGSPTRGNEICAYLAKALKLPAFTSVSRIEMDGDSIRILRKLEKGKRQVIKADVPALIAILPAKNWTSPPSLESQIKAEETPLAFRKISYYGLMRKAVRPSDMNISWQPLPLAPATQEIYRPLHSFHPSKRLEQLMQGESTSRKAVKVNGTPKECAGKIVSFLTENKLIKLNR